MGDLAQQAAPPQSRLDLAVGEGYGKVSWDVRAIWELLAGWFYYEDVADLYEVPSREIYPDLVELAVDFAVHHLKPDGALLVKCFHGSGYSQLVELFKRRFVRVAVRKPKSSRAESAETYLLGRGLKVV